jgi:hypothetical protein
VTIKDSSASADPTSGEKTAPTSAALSTEFTWSQTQGHATLMWSIYDGYCALTGVSGNFEGTGEGVEVAQWGTTWVLNGWSGQLGVSARARCISWSDLGNNGWGTQSFSAGDRGPRDPAAQNRSRSIRRQSAWGSI